MLLHAASELPPVRSSHRSKPLPTCVVAAGTIGGATESDTYDRHVLKLSFSGRTSMATEPVFFAVIWNVTVEPIVAGLLPPVCTLVRLRLGLVTVTVAVAGPADAVPETLALFVPGEHATDVEPVK